MTAFNDAKAVIGLSPLFSEVHQFGQIWLSDYAIVAAQIGTYACVGQPYIVPDIGVFRFVSSFPHAIPDARVGSGNRSQDGSA